MNDLKLAWRSIRNAPLFTAVAVGTMALAIGANTAIFSVADAFLFRPLPYADPDRLFVLRMVNPQTGLESWSLPPPAYLQAIVEHNRGAFAVGMRESITITPDQGEQDARWLATTQLTADYLKILGVRPLRGRLFDAKDAADPGATAILSYRGWQERFGGDERIVGRSVTLGTSKREVIGVLPRGFMLPGQYVTASMTEPGHAQFDYFTVDTPRFRHPSYEPVVRLASGTTREQAEAQIEALVAPLRAAANAKDRDSVPKLVDVRSVVFPTSRPLMTALVAASVLILLIGCTNIGTLFLARARRREREMGVRLALGARRRDVIRPMLFEAALIALAGALAAVLLTVLVFNSLLLYVPARAYGDAALGVDWRVVVFTLGLGVASGILFSVAPAWRAMRLDVQRLVQGRDGAREDRYRLPGVMIAVQVALTLILVLGAGIATRTLVSALRIPLGFDSDNVMAAVVEPEVPDTGAFYMHAIQMLRNRPEVVAAGAGSGLPLSHLIFDEQVMSSGDQTRVMVAHVLPGYFESIGLRLLRGRLLASDEGRTAADVGVLSESAARALFPGADPIGRTFTTASGRAVAVVRVVADTLGSFNARWNRPVAYAMPKKSPNIFTLVARMRHRDAQVLSRIRREISQLAPGTPVSISWWTDAIGELTEYQSPRLQALVLGTFGALALVLTVLGIFGTVTFLVGARTREIAVRTALGATRRSVAVLFVRRTMLPVTVGIVASLVATRWLAPLAQAQLVKVDTKDVLVFGVAVATVVVAAATAAYLPARRAAGLDSTAVLRAE